MLLPTFDVIVVVVVVMYTGNVMSCVVFRVLLLLLGKLDAFVGTVDIAASGSFIGISFCVVLAAAVLHVVSSVVDDDDVRVIKRVSAVSWRRIELLAVLSVVVM